MKEKSYPEGSTWRKWDLHVHTPQSHGFKGDWEQFIIQLGKADCDVIGINDYFSVAGYQKVLDRLNEQPSKSPAREYQEALEKLKRKTFLPVVECRMTHILVSKNTNNCRINFHFHIIFDPSVVKEVPAFIQGLEVSNDSKIGTQYKDSIIPFQKCRSGF